MASEVDLLTGKYDICGRFTGHKSSRRAAVSKSRDLVLHFGGGVKKQRSCPSLRGRRQKAEILSFTSGAEAGVSRMWLLRPISVSLKEGTPHG
jgi:hypothetical protein